MLFFRLLFLSILLYYTEAWDYYDDLFADIFSVDDKTKEVPTPAPLDRDTHNSNSNTAHTHSNSTATGDKNTTTSRPYYSNRTKIPEDSNNQTTTTETFKTTTTSRLYDSYWGYGPSSNVTSGTIDNTKPYDWNKKREGYENTTARRSYHSYWNNRYNRTTEGNDAVEKTNTTERPYIPGWNNWGRRHRAYYTTSTTENSDTTTTERPYISDWHTWYRRHRAHYTTSTTENSDTTTTERPYIPDRYTWERRPGAYYTTTTEDSPYWGNRTSYYTTTTEDSPYWGNRTSYYTTTTENSPYWGNTTSYYTTSTTEGSDTTTTRRPCAICPRGRNSTVGSRWSTSTDGPVKISINTSINTNGAGNNVAIADFLKKLTGAMLPSASNIAPNSNITHLAVANGNGNMFFYIYN